MEDVLLLKFRDLVTETIEEHNNIIDQRNKKRILWGWWKKPTEPFPDPMLMELKDLLDDRQNGQSIIYFINSGSKKFYSAKLYRIHYMPTKGDFVPKDANRLCPEYYRTNALPAWFEIGKISQVEPTELEDYVFSSRNTTYEEQNKAAINKKRIGQPIDTTNFTFLEDNVTLWFLCKKTDLTPTSISVFPNIFNKTYLTRGKYILHLSDLHFGGEHAFAIPDGKRNLVGRQTMIDSICRDLSAQKIPLSDIALVLISGDLTCTANAHEFDAANSFIEKLEQRFGIGAGQVICIPGNHDIEWVNENGSLNENAELNYRNFSRNLYGNPAEESLIRINEFQIGDKRIAVFAINSCRIESRETAGMGYVGAEQLQLIEDFVNENTDINYKIAIIHHHVLPVNYTENYSLAQKNVSLLLDSEAFMQSMIKARINTILHGHQHQPYFSQITRFIPQGVAGNEEGLSGILNIIGGGSAGVGPAQLNSIGRNAYNILELTEDEKHDIKLNVKLRVRNSNGAGYITGWEKQV